jgi:DNA polymerase III alpha subunit (gram-positive type)
MNARLIQSQKLLHDSLFDLYMQGGLEMVTMGSRGVKRELIVELEMSGLTPDTGEIIRYRAVNRWDSEDEFDEWARPMAALTPEAERIVGVTNEQLAGCRPSEVVLEDFFELLHQKILT